MAENRDNVKGNFLDVFIGNAGAPFHAQVTLSQVVNLHAVKSQRTGDIEVANIVMGSTPVLGIEIQEWELGIYARSLGAVSDGNGGYVAPRLGSQAPTFPVRLHDPQEVDEQGDPKYDGDIVFPRCVFDGFARTVNGQGEARHTVNLKAQLRTDDDSTFEIGYTPE